MAAVVSVIVLTGGARLLSLLACNEYFWAPSSLSDLRASVTKLMWRAVVRNIRKDG